MSALDLVDASILAARDKQLTYVPPAGLPVSVASDPRKGAGRSRRKASSLDSAPASDGSRLARSPVPGSRGSNANGENLRLNTDWRRAISKVGG